jgi:hypothetical protein
VSVRGSILESLVSDLFYWDFECDTEGGSVGIGVGNSAVRYRGADKSLARPGRKKSYSDRRL